MQSYRNKSVAFFINVLELFPRLEIISVSSRIIIFEIRKELFTHYRGNLNIPFVHLNILNYVVNFFS